MKRIYTFVLLFSIAFLISTSNVFADKSVVDRGCNIQNFSMNPVDPYILGDHVQLLGTSNCGTVKFEINGQSKSETGQPNQNMTWKTEEFGSGTHQVCFVARGEGGWENADRRCRTVYVEGGQAPPSGSNNNGNVVRCWINSFGVTPGSLGKGEVFHLSGQGQCDGNARASRFSLDDNPFSETGSYQNSANLATNNISTGIHKLCFHITGGDWKDAATSCVNVTVNASGPSGNDTAQGGQTNNNVPGQTDQSNPDGAPSFSEPQNPSSNYLSRDHFDGWSVPPNESRVYVPSEIDVLRLRTEPNYNADILGYAAASNWYILLNEKKDWVKIQTRNGTIGWVDIQYVKVDHISPNQNINPPEPEPQADPSQDIMPSSDTLPNNLLPATSSVVDTSMCAEQSQVDNRNWFEKLFSIEVQAYTPYDSLQCTAYADESREDVDIWLERGSAYQWSQKACDSAKASEMGITVSIGDVRFAQPGDIVVWDKSCGADRNNGHVAIVQSVDITNQTIYINDRNWDGKGGDRTNIPVKVKSCMSFIHKPNSSLDNSFCSGETISPAATIITPEPEKTCLKIFSWTTPICWNKK